MKEKPAIQDELLIAQLDGDYRLQIADLIFLPIGADADSASYRVTAGDGQMYFLKLRRRKPLESALTVPRFLTTRGIAHVIAPLPTLEQRLRTQVAGFTLILYPYIEGRNGYEADLPDRQWVELGLTLRQIHSIGLPDEILSHLSVEDFSPQWRSAVRRFLDPDLPGINFDPVAEELARLLADKHSVIYYMLERAEQLAAILRSLGLRPVLCHTDLHAGNLLIEPSGNFYIVDWDDPELAPREHDLMFVGSGAHGVWSQPRTRELFFRGYGPLEVNQTAVVYYWYERIVQDIAADCEQIFMQTVGGEDRKQSLRYLQNVFQPGHEVDRVREADQRLG